MAHGRGKKPPTRKEARRPNNKGAVRFGHHMPDKVTERFNADPNNLPRQRRKLSHGASLGTLGSVWDPINMPVGGIFTLSEAAQQEYDKVERPAINRCVVGSSPTIPTIRALSSVG